MTLAMARCIGRTDCDDEPNGGRGLCRACYARHYYRGSLKNYPTMRERTASLRASGFLPARRTRYATVEAATNAARASGRWRAEKHANRFVVDGNLVSPEAPHGRVGSYTSYGCRGPMCYAAQQHYKVTGECALPGAFLTRFSLSACVSFRSDVYPDRRK